MSTVAERLRERIRTEGPLPFAAFMEEALYGEGGYYNREVLAIGESGDFVTGSSLSPLFGRTTARLLAKLDEVLARPAALLEAGYGGGAHLAAVAASMAAPRQLLGWDRVPRELPEGVESIFDLEDLGAPIEGLVFSYELFDASPVHRLIGAEDGEIGELRVALAEDGQFRWQPAFPAVAARAALAMGERLLPGQVADLAPDWGPLYRRLAGTLERGLIVTCDYGFERPALLDPRVRSHGTLACYRRHRVHRDALRAPGEQDLTAHIDFTTLRDVGEAMGLETVTLTRQALWLAALGLFEEVDQEDASERRAAAALLDPGGMGEEIRVLVQARGVNVGEILDLELLGA